MWWERNICRDAKSLHAGVVGCNRIPSFLFREALLQSRHDRGLRETWEEAFLPSSGMAVTHHGTTLNLRFFVYKMIIKSLLMVVLEIKLQNMTVWV